MGEERGIRSQLSERTGSRTAVRAITPTNPPPAHPPPHLLEVGAADDGVAHAVVAAGRAKHGGGVGEAVVGQPGGREEGVRLSGVPLEGQWEAVLQSMRRAEPAACNHGHAACNHGKHTQCAHSLPHQRV